MDHKKFFEHFGNHQLFPTEWGWEFTTEILYQAIKARLIEELRTETMKNEYGQPSFLRLIDTTGGANGR